MNFLAHFHLLKEQNDPDVVLGNLLPDLMRGFTKIYHKEIRNNIKLIDNQIIKGIHFHLKTDALFHQHQFFIEQNEKIKQSIIQHNLPINRYYITTHILLELLIDQYLIKQNEDLAIQFYNSLRKSANEDFIEKLNLIFKNNDNSKVFLIFKSFIKNEYAFAISKNKGIKFALNQIIGNKIGIDYKKDNWDLVINQSYETLKVDLPHFLNNINIELQNA